MTNINQDELAPGIAIGGTIAGKYRVDALLGSGGMGVVIKATHLELREAVAIKLLHPEVSQHPEATARFLREARSAARLRSSHAARTTDVGTLENGQRYMVMEYLQGEDLAALLTKQGPLPIALAVEYLLQACDAVAEAHQLGIIHRDLKPANLFVVQQSDGAATVKVLDFGISKAVDLQSSRSTGLLTRSQAMIGTPVYASPEQLASAADVDVRTDIWSLGGVVLYELLTGAPPFTGKTIEELVARVVSWSPPPLRAVRPDVPAPIEHIVMSCLQKDRELRYASVAELVEALASVSAGDLGVESQILASRIVRKYRSIPPAAELAPTRSASSGPSPDPLPAKNVAGNTPLNPGMRHRTPNLEVSEETYVSEASKRVVQHSDSTHAGLYASRPSTRDGGRKRTGSLAVLGLGAVLLVGVGVWLTLRSGTTASSSAASDGSAAEATTALMSHHSGNPTTTAVSASLPVEPSLKTDIMPVTAEPMVQRPSPLPRAASIAKPDLSRNQRPIAVQAPASVATPPPAPPPASNAGQNTPVITDRHGMPERTPSTGQGITDFGPRR